jgi:uncharacterized cupin superfamily protein
MRLGAPIDHVASWGTCSNGKVTGERVYRTIGGKRNDTMTDATDKAAGLAIDASTVMPRIGAPYPAPYDEPCAGREKRALGDAFGLSNFGVNLTRLPPGCASAQRHWHSRQDELIYVLHGELVLVTDAGEQVLTPGMTAGFPAGVPNGHMLVNRSSGDAVYLEVGDRTEHDEVEYPECDMAVRVVDGKRRRVRKDGTAF